MHPKCWNRTKVTQDRTEFIDHHTMQILIHEIQAYLSKIGGRKEAGASKLNRKSDLPATLVQLLSDVPQPIDNGLSVLYILVHLVLTISEGFT